MPSSSFPSPRIETVGELVADAARRWADAPFLTPAASGNPITFGALERRVRALAGGLRAAGVSPGDVVCTTLASGEAAGLTLLGGMCAGALVCPINPQAGRAALSVQLRHCGPRLLVGEHNENDAVRDALRDLGSPVAVAEPAELEDGSALSIGAVGADDPALLMYTSGSTGKPKGVVLTQRQILARAASTVRFHRLSSKDRLLCVLPLYHMNPVELFLGALHSGGGIVVPPRHGVAGFWRAAGHHGCTWSALVPAMVSMLLGSDSDPADVDSARNSLRFVRCSSAPVNPDLHRQFEIRFGVVLVEGMGTTETGGLFLNPPTRAERKIGSMGVARAQVQIRRSSGEMAASGEVGELFTRGECVMQGYFKDPEATAAQWDPEGWWRTGDLVRRDEDGFFFHVGRKDDVIIKGGMNIAPREIEEVLEAHPDVGEAAVVGLADPLLGEEIVAFAVPRDGAAFDQAAVLLHCERQLGVFKTPARVEVRERLPRNALGKVVRAELKGQEPAPARAVAAPRLSRKELEKAIADVWRARLGTRAIDPDDDYFAAGGTSMLAVELVAELRRRLGVDLTLGMFFETPTVAGQAAVIEALVQGRRVSSLRAGGEAASALLLAPVGDAAGQLPLFGVYGPGKYRWLAQALGRRQPVYCAVARFEMEPALAAVEGGPPYGTVEDLAAVYLQAIRCVQPHGPYQLMGFSFGGRVAFEMAQQLRAQSEEVRLLVLIDTFLPGALRRRRVEWMVSQAAAFARAPRTRLRRLVARWRSLSPRWQRYMGNDALEAVRHRSDELRRVLRGRHRPQPYAGRIVLIRAARPPLHYDYADPTYGWAQLAGGGFDVEEVAGDHDDILERANAAAVAARLRPYLAGNDG